MPPRVNRVLVVAAASLLRSLCIHPPQPAMTTRLRTPAFKSYRDGPDGVRRRTHLSEPSDSPVSVCLSKYACACVCTYDTNIASCDCLCAPVARTARDTSNGRKSCEESARPTDFACPPPTRVDASPCLTSPLYSHAPSFTHFTLLPSMQSASLLSEAAAAAGGGDVRLTVQPAWMTVVDAVNSDISKIQARSTRAALLLYFFLIYFYFF